MMSIPEMIKAGLAAGTKEAAAAIVAERVGEMMLELGYKPDKARDIVLQNIGYYTGYFDNDKADRVMELFETEHPIFGKTHPSPEEAFRLGKAFGEGMRAKEQR
jgi:hypothetical protein